MKYRACILLIPCLLCFFPSSSAADENPWTHTFYFENDLFSGTDSNYTNGIKYSLISPNVSPEAPDGKLPRKVLKYIHEIPFIARSGYRQSHKVEFSIGQNMYTPSDIESFDLIEDDRPYAGWTYLSTSYHRKNEARQYMNFLDTVEIQFGIVGPESFAEDSQKLVHDIRDLERPNGWHNQLKNEPGLEIVFERKWLFHSMEMDRFGLNATTHMGGALGNVYTYLNTGLELRFGWNVPHDFGVSLIRPAGSTRLRIKDTFSIFLFGATNAKAVARDIFLDGNTFTDSHSVDKKHFVADVAGGIAVNYKKIIFTWTQILRTKEFKDQESRHSFGSIALSYSVPYDLQRIVDKLWGDGINGKDQSGTPEPGTSL